MTTIDANGYGIHFGPIGETGLNKVVDEYREQGRKIIVLVDENSFKHCFPRLRSEVNALDEAEVIEVASGEENKNLETCQALWETLVKMNANRKSLVINLGGGVITDMGGFVASTFKRGIPFINVPTTLLSQVDASVGGKTGVDLNNLKNLIGVINNPLGVYIDGEFLKTLSRREIMSGFAEMVKHALISDKDHWEQIRTTDFTRVDHFNGLVEHSVSIKNEIVKEDPTEQGRRKLLNFGHTIGHALETFSLETDIVELLHGEAIAIGMVCESYLSHKKGYLKEKEVKEIAEFILPFYPQFKVQGEYYHRLLEIMKNDKKNEDDGINFSVLKKIGEGDINEEFNYQDITEALDYYKGFLK